MDGVNITAAVLAGEVGLDRGGLLPRKPLVEPGEAPIVGVGGELEGELPVLGMEVGGDAGTSALVGVGGELEGVLTVLGMRGEGDAEVGLDAGDTDRLGVEADGVGETAATGVIAGAPNTGVGVAFVGAGDETVGAFAGLVEVIGDEAGVDTGAKADMKGAPTGAPRAAH